MTIQPIGSTSVALYITPADLKERGLTPSGLTLERALELTQDAFAQAGITLDGSIEIEAYPDACGRAGLCPCQRAGAHLALLWRSGDSFGCRTQPECPTAGRRPLLVGRALLALLSRRSGAGGQPPVRVWPPGSRPGPTRRPAWRNTAACLWTAMHWACCSPFFPV